MAATSENISNNCRCRGPIQVRAPPGADGTFGWKGDAITRRCCIPLKGRASWFDNNKSVRRRRHQAQAGCSSWSDTPSGAGCISHGRAPVFAQRSDCHLSPSEPIAASRPELGHESRSNPPFLESAMLVPLDTRRWRSLSQTPRWRWQPTKAMKTAVDGRSPCELRIGC